MNEASRILIPSQRTRPSFLQRSTMATGAALLSTRPVERSAHAAGSDELKLMLVGCSGRGAGAAHQALSTPMKDRSSSSRRPASTAEEMHGYSHSRVERD